MALAHRAQLLSKDALVLRLARRLLPLGVVVGLWAVPRCSRQAESALIQPQ